MPEAQVSADHYSDLANAFEVLSSKVRIGLLHALRTPRSLHEIRITATVEDSGARTARPLARQTLTRHLAQLQRAQFVRRSRGGREGMGDTYAINHERLFAFSDEVRGIAKLRPTVLDPGALEQTVDQGTAAQSRLPDPPRLLVAYGRDEGVAFGLPGPVGSSWIVGRAPGCHIQIDYDPYASMRHAAVSRAAHGFLIQDLRSRNGTAVNWSPLPAGGSRPLAPGDLVGVGRTLLVLQA